MKNLKNNTGHSQRISDAPYSNWVDRYCPLWSKPYLKLSRIDRPIGTWLLLLPCWWGSSLAICSNSGHLGYKDLWIILGCTIGAVLMRGAGCTWNDINDRHFDAKVARTKLRPLPSGQISINQALIWLLIQLSLSFLVLLSFNQFAILVGLISLIPVAIYPFAKRFTWWPQFFLGISFNWGILLSFAAHTNTIEASTIVLYFAGVFWTLFYDTIYAFQDTEDDSLIGLKSTALLFGDHAKYWLAVFIFIIFLTMQISFGLISQLNFVSEATLRGGSIIFCFHLLWQLWKLDIYNSDLCLKLFKANKNSGLIIIIFAFIAIVFTMH